MTNAEALLLKNGETVRLKSGGPNLTFCYYHSGSGVVHVMWFDTTNQLQKSSLSAAVIEKVEPTIP